MTDWRTVADRVARTVAERVARTRAGRVARTVAGRGVWPTVARREVRGLVRTRTARGGVALVALVFVLGGYVLPTSVRDPTVVDYDALLRGVVAFAVPLFGLLAGYRAIVAERAAGRLALLLSLPHSRAGVVLGTFVGRGCVLVGTLAAGVLGGAALVAYPFGTVEPGRLAVYLGATLLFGLAYLAVGLGLSTLTASPRRATVLTFGVFVLSVVAWPQLPRLVLLGLDYLNLASDGLPDWALFVHGAEPGMLYRRVLDAFVAGVERGSYLGPDAAWYLRGGPAAVLLVGWVVAPTVGGYLRFRGTDL